MAVNFDKTKVMVFRKGGHRARSEKWFLDGNAIGVTSYYKYLGLVLSSRNSWSKAVATLAEQADKALVIVSNASRNVGGFPFNSHFKLFDSLILPILLYGSEIWGYQYFEDLEKVQRKWCRKLLGLPRTPQMRQLLENAGVCLSLFQV